MKTNTKSIDYRRDTETRLAGGAGLSAAKQSPEALLRRSVMACLLWEDNFYQSGNTIANEIKRLVPLVAPGVVSDIAVEARTKQKLRHVPLFLAREMARLDTHKALVGELLPHIILRADELAEFVSLYWKDGKEPLSKQVKIGLAAAFDKFNAYEFAKYNRDSKVKLRDVMFLVHPKPANKEREGLYRQIANDTLPTPDTWEVALSAGKDKRETWERLIKDKKLGALAFLRNLRNMRGAGVSADVISQGFETVNPQWILPLNILAAVKYAPEWMRECETLMMRGLKGHEKLSGHSVVIVDVSGSMDQAVSSKSDFTRLDAGATMAMLAAELCERVSIYVTAGNDNARKHNTAHLKPYRGFALVDAIKVSRKAAGGGGIFTRQCLEWIKAIEKNEPDRIMIFSDSQDCDLDQSKLPHPFGKRNYIIDVSAHTRGINFDGVWDAEISGWSEHFLTYITGLEGLTLADNSLQ